MGPEGSNLKFSENGCDFWALEKSYYRSGFFVDIGLPETYEMAQIMLPNI